MRLVLTALALSTLVTLPASQAGASTTQPEFSPGAFLPQDKGTHKDERFGFSFKPPKGWRSVALKADEVWLAAKYTSDKSYFHTDETGYTSEHVPEVLVVAFQHKNQEKKRIEEVEEEGGVKVTSVVITNPYEDYEDFLDKTYAGGGWYVSEKKEDQKHGDLKVTKYEVKVEKLARTGPKRVVTWIYHVEDIDFVVQFEWLEPEYKKLKKHSDKLFKSFKEIERNGELLPTAGAETGGIRLTRRELTTGTPKERRTVRMTSQRDKHDKAIATLPEDWDHDYHGDVLVLNHNQDKWCDRLGGHAEAYLKWLEDTFSYYGKGEYARAPIIRVCENVDEAAAYLRGTTSGTGGGWRYIFPGNEIVTYKDNGGFIGSEVDYVNRSILVNWMSERDEDTTSALPYWIDYGITAYAEGARLDGRKLEFRVDQYAKDGARLAISQGTYVPLRDLLQFTQSEFVEGGDRNRLYQSSMFVRYLLSRDCRRCKQAKSLMEDYLTTLMEIVAEAKESEDNTWDAVKRPETEEEEEEMAKARSERWKAREKEFMDKVNERVFGDWSDKDWASLEKAFQDWL